MVDMEPTGDTLEDRVERLESALDAMREHYEERIAALESERWQPDELDRVSGGKEG